jgi:hypothetical protein
MKFWTASFSKSPVISSWVTESVDSQAYKHQMINSILHFLKTNNTGKICTFDQVSNNCSESTGMDRFLSDKYFKIHFSSNGLLFFTTWAGSVLVSTGISFTVLELSDAALVLLSSGLAGSVVEMK